MLATTKAKNTTDPIESARRVVERLHAAEVDLTDRRAAKVAELSEAEREAGAVTLNAALSGGGTAPAVISRAAMLQAEIGAIDQAIDTARMQRREAIVRVWHEEAKPLRARAEELRREADARQPKTAELLRQLEEWEGIRYEPRQPLPAGVIPADFQGGAPLIIEIPTPRTALLRLEADGLDQQAADLERRTVPDRGSVQAGNADELIERIRAWDAMMIAPTLTSVTAWARAAEQRQQERIARSISPAALQSWAAEARKRLSRTFQDGSVTEADAAGRPSMRLTLAWVAGVIDERQSRGSVPALDS